MIYYNGKTLEELDHDYVMDNITKIISRFLFQMKDVKPKRIVFAEYNKEQLEMAAKYADEVEEDEN